MRKFLDPLDSTSICELRGLKADGSVGLQTVVPPGIHVSGEPIEFVEQGSPAEIAADLLSSSLAKVATAALLAKHWPVHGRHLAMLALAGILARDGWPIAEAKKFCHAVYCAVPTHDPKAIDRSDSEVDSTYEKHAAGQEITGFPKLAEVVNRSVLSTALEWLGMEIPDWRTSLICGKSGPKPILANACDAFRNASEWANVLAFDEFSLRVVADNPTPWNKGGTWTNDDDLRACEWLHRQGIFASTRVANEAIEVISRERAFHPVRDFLCGLPVWDNIERTPHWLTVCFGAPDDAYTRAISSRWLISAVARIFQPGCQVDHVLTLIGPQGIMKSTALRTLTGADWFTDRLSDLGSKDSMVELQGKWIVEISELSAVRRSQLEATKSFLTRRSDFFRPHYGRRAEDFRRQCVFCASTNDSEIFTDSSGNRRFWPIQCTKIDIEALREYRELLWAEAYARYKAGEPWWLESPELTALAESEQAKHYEGGARDELITSWILDPQRRERVHSWDEELPWHGSRPGKINIQDILVHCFGIPVAQLKPSDSREVGRCLRHLGWNVGVQENSGPHRGKRFCIAPAKAKDF